MMLRTTILACLGAVMLLSCCSESSPEQTAEASVTSHAPLTETYWKLVEISGIAVPPAHSGELEAHLTLINQGNLARGYAGCNAFRGSYEGDEAAQRLKFGKMASTLKACEQIAVEQQFLQMLEMVDSYTIRGDTLSLQKARMAPLARFVAVYQ